MLTINNPRIISYYENNTHLNFEQVNLSFIDILEKLQTDMQDNAQKTFSGEMLEKIFNNVEKIKDTQDNSQQNNINIHATLSSIQTIITSQKETYINEIKDIIDHKYLDSNEKIQAIISKSDESLLDKTKLFLRENLANNNKEIQQKILTDFEKIQFSLQGSISKMMEDKNQDSLFQNINSLIDNKNHGFIENMQSLLHKYISESNDKLYSKINEQHATIEGVGSYIEKQKCRNSSDIGKDGEDELEPILNKCFPNANIEVTAGQSKSGDFIIERENTSNKRILVENKVYSKNTPPKEVSKFLRDIDNMKCPGIFLSQTSGIAGKSNFEINFHGDYLCLYLHNVNYDEDKIGAAVQILDIMANKIGSMDNIDTTQISKEVLNSIQCEFLAFVSQKNSLLEISKTFHSDLMKTIDNFEFPSLQKLLSLNFSNPELKPFTCKFCNLSFKSQRALGAHGKGCKKKNIIIETAINNVKENSD